MPSPWELTVCDVPWCYGHDPAHPHTVDDDLSAVQRIAVKQHRWDVWNLAEECRTHEPVHTLPDGRTVSLAEHVEFVALAREAATGPDPNNPGMGSDWVACIEALQHGGGGGGVEPVTAIRDAVYAEFALEVRARRVDLLQQLLERRRRGEKPTLPKKYWGRPQA
jgi:hypothetical protein